ncbi:Metallo-dependent phosphatase-like protein [Lipomyces arxii]|uniref:Metallo-dependent phosphatase-like protein n=1 Tax=Lipomyces arxii TaxID=56418 RepID=UPI0034CF84A6
MQLITLVLALAGAGLAQINVPGSIPQNPVEPLQHHVAYAGVNGMTVSWHTYAEIDDPTVFYGTDIWNLSNTAVGESVTFATSQTWANHVKLTGLEPDTTYYYFVSNTNCGNCSELHPYTFTTARNAGDMTPYTIAVVIDLGVMGEDGLSTTSLGPIAPGETTTIQSLARYIDGYDFLWHPGDIAYADYWLKEQVQDYLDPVPLEDGYKVYNRLLNTYYDQMQPVTAEKPYMVGPGNHEANCDNGGTSDKKKNITYTESLCLKGQTNFTGYTNHFRMPSYESNGVGSFWYSWDNGMVHYVQIDTETDLGHNLIGPDELGGSNDDSDGPFGLKNQQIEWLDKDLAAVDRTKTPWVIVSGHRPWYAAQSGDNLCTNCQEAFEPILLKHNVDLVLNGHIHFYERNTPIGANGVPDPNGLNNPSAPWYILNGAGGHYDGLDVYDDVLPDYAEYVQDTVYGWSKLTFHNCTHLTHEFVASANGTILDSATLIKHRTCAAPSNYSMTSNSTLPIVDENAGVSLRSSYASLVGVAIVALFTLV